MSETKDTTPYQMPEFDLAHWLEVHEHHNAHGCAVCEAVAEIRWSRKKIKELWDEAIEAAAGMSCRISECKCSDAGEPCEVSEGILELKID